jgi:hypothetical protein
LSSREFDVAGPLGTGAGGCVRRRRIRSAHMLNRVGSGPDRPRARRGVVAPRYAFVIQQVRQRGMFEARILVGFIASRIDDGDRSRWICESSGNTRLSGWIVWIFRDE